MQKFSDHWNRSHAHSLIPEEDRSKLPFKVEPNEQVFPEYDALGPIYSLDNLYPFLQAGASWGIFFPLPYTLPTDLLDINMLVKPYMGTPDTRPFPPTCELQRKDLAEDVS